MPGDRQGYLAPKSLLSPEPAPGFAIAGPKDAGMLDVVGFDGAAPQVMRSFAVH